MKKLLYTSVFLLAFITSNAQKDFQGMAVYESKTSTGDMKTAFSGNKDISPEMQKMIEERVKKALEKTFILNFDKSASIYKEEEKLDTPGTQGGGGGMRMMFNSFTGGGGTYYKNIKDKTYTSAKSLWEKNSLLRIHYLNWTGKWNRRAK
jgi:GLPGLI family protein